jgi:hypothetical protein
MSSRKDEATAAADAIRRRVAPTMKPLTHVVSFVPLANTPGKKDVTGAFAPEARSFAKTLALHGARCVAERFDATAPKAGRAHCIAQALQREHPIDAVAFFCHGTIDAIQAGFTRRSVDALAQALAVCGTEDLTVLLYCCSTGDDPKGRSLAAPGTGDRSFADLLRDALCRAGKTRCRVVAHATAGHTTRNPYVLFFEGMGSPVGGIGGIAPVAPRHPLWRTWRNTLRDTDLRFRFGLLGVDEIHRELEERELRQQAPASPVQSLRA